MSKFIKDLIQDKLTFVMNYVPCAEIMTAALKERICFGFEEEHLVRSNVAAKKGIL